MSKYIKTEKKNYFGDFYTKNSIERRRKKDYNVSMLVFMSIMVLTTIMPVVSRAISSTVTTYSLLLVMAYLLLTFFLNRGGRQSGIYVKVLLVCMPLFALEFMNQLVSSGQSMFMWGYHWLLMILPVFMGVYLLQNSDAFAVSLGKVYFGAIFITLITTIIGLYNNPFAARFLATVVDTDNSYFASLNWQNIGGYAFVYMTVLLYPMVICAYKQKKIKTWQMVLVVFLLAWLYIKAEYVTALLLFIVSSTLLFAKRKLKFRSVVLVVLTAAVFFILFSSTIGEFLYLIANKVESITISERIIYIADQMLGKDTNSQVGNRSDVLLQSLNMFFHSPVIGTFLSKGVPGGHSFILDMLARYGLFGAGALSLLYVSIYRIFYLPYKEKPYYIYMVFSFLQVLFLSTVNTGDWLFVLTLGIPIIVKLMERKTKNGGVLKDENIMGN